MRNCKCLLTLALALVVASAVGLDVKAVNAQGAVDKAGYALVYQNSNSYQTSYDIYAKKAERLYKALTAKRYVGSEKTRRVDIKAYKDAQREMRNIAMKARAAGQPVVQSKYQTLSVD